MRTILIMKAWKLVADPNPPFLMTPETMETVDWDALTNEERVAKIEEWTLLDYEWNLDFKVVKPSSQNKSESIEQGGFPETPTRRYLKDLSV